MPGASKPESTAKLFKLKEVPDNDFAPGGVGGGPIDDAKQLRSASSGLLVAARRDFRRATDTSPLPMCSFISR